MTTNMGEPVGLKIYRALSRAAEPVANFALQHRLRSGKEHPERVGERRGQSNLKRPDGPLFWIHGASVGESLSVIPLVTSTVRIAARSQFFWSRQEPSHRQN